MSNKKIIQRPHKNAPKDGSFRLFLTAEDPRELPKGSRDPLRFLPTWSAVGRRMIPNLTTVTPSYRGFLTRFLFHGALELYKNRLRHGSSDEQWDAFCRFEQLCAVVRSELEPKTPRLPGSTSVPGRLIDGQFFVGTHSKYMLGKSQKTTGFWGYYQQASQSSGILKLNSADRPGYLLSEAAMEALNNSPAVGVLNEIVDELQEVFQKKVVQLDINAFADLSNFFSVRPIDHPGAARFWTERLLMPSIEPSRAEIEREFAESVRSVLSEDADLQPYDIWEKLCSDRATESVAAHATQVSATEAIIGLCEWIFDVCRLRGEDNATLASASDWALHNGFNSDWLDRLKAQPAPRDPVLQELREISLTGVQRSFVPLAQALLHRHCNVMRARGGAPWVSDDGNGNLTIREPAENPSGPDIERFPSGVRWRYDYFLRSWLTAAREIGYLTETPANA